MTSFKGDDMDSFTYVDDDGDTTNVVARVAHPKAGAKPFIEISNESQDEGTGVSVYVELDDMPEFISRLLNVCHSASRLV